MGTYTANKNLYMPTVGEQGWGDLMNTNLSTIDNFLKPITVSGSTYTFTGNHVGNQSGGTITATKITNSGTLTQTGTSTFTGKITANGGIGTKALTATSISNSGTLTQTGTSTFTGKITANGGVNDYEERITALEAGEFETITVNNFIGKINVSTDASTSSTSGDVLAYVVDYPASSSGNKTLTTTATKYTITVPVGNVIKKNTSIINYTGSTTQDSTCTITVNSGSNSGYKAYFYYNITVTNNETGETVLSTGNKSNIIGPGSYGSYDYTFTRCSDNTYTITANLWKGNYSGTGKDGTFNSCTVSTSTPSVSAYLV